jgi:hypothetical protein
LSRKTANEEARMAEEWNLPSGDLMKGKRGIVMGVANQNSIAFPNSWLRRAPRLRSPIRARRWSAVSARSSRALAWT